MTDYVHPGIIPSIRDDDWHHIGFEQLCRLYGLNPRKTVNAEDPHRMMGRRESPEDRHFYPRVDGDYEKGPQ